MSSKISSHQSEWTQPDRRAFPRIPFDCPVRWNSGGADRPGRARDVSEGGAGFTVRAMSAPKVGQAIRLMFELDPRLEWIVDERATVERCDEQSSGLWDVGVRLNELEMR